MIRAMVCTLFVLLLCSAVLPLPAQHLADTTRLDTPAGVARLTASRPGNQEMEVQVFFDWHGEARHVLHYELEVIKTGRSTSRTRQSGPLPGDIRPDSPVATSRVRLHPDTRLQVRLTLTDEHGNQFETLRMSD